MRFAVESVFLNDFFALSWIGGFLYIYYLEFTSMCVLYFDSETSSDSQSSSDSESKSGGPRGSNSGKSSPRQSRTVEDSRGQSRTVLDCPRQSQTRFSGFSGVLAVGLFDSVIFFRIKLGCHSVSNGRTLGVLVDSCSFVFSYLLVD